MASGSLSSEPPSIPLASPAPGSSRRLQVLLEVEQDGESQRCPSHAAAPHHHHEDPTARRRRLSIMATTTHHAREQILLKGDLPSDTILEYYDVGLGAFKPFHDDATFSDLHNPLRVTAHPPVRGAMKTAPLLSLPWRQFDVDLGNGDFVIGGRPVRVHGVENSGQGTGHTTWDGAVILAKYLDFQETQLVRQVVSRRRVLETGAGTGLAGLAAAMLGAEHVLLTDLPYTLPNLHTNVELNREALEATHGLVEVAGLDWFNVSATDVGHVDVILAADVVWLNELVEPFVSALRKLTDGDNHEAETFAHYDFLVDPIPPQDYHPQFISEKITIYRIHRPPLSP